MRDGRAGICEDLPFRIVAPLFQVASRMESLELIAGRRVLVHGVPGALSHEEGTLLGSRGGWLISCITLAIFFNVCRRWASKHIAKKGIKKWQMKEVET